MMATEPFGERHGLSLMEVLVALTIFLLAFVGLGRLVILGSDQAVDAQQQVQAADLCQTKLAEVIAGALPLMPQSEVPFDNDLLWHWSLQCEKSNFPGLWNVTVLVSRQQPQGSRVRCTLTQMVLDPQIHGNVQDAPPGTPPSSDPSSPSRSSRSGGASTSGSTGSVGGGN